MRLWRFSDPGDCGYARATRRGSWEGNPSRRVTPLIIEWEPDSDVLGDFTWPGFDSDIVVTDAVAKALQGSGVPGFELGAVKMQENSEPAKRRSKRPRVKLPYSGPQLWDLWVTAWTSPDRDRSTITEVQREDGSRYFEVAGVQRREKTWDQRRMELVTVLHPRVEGKGLFVPPIRGIFRVRDVPGWIFCTDDVKRLIEEHGFTNVSFLEMGDVLKA
jgi:hypothetical protein